MDGICTICMEKSYDSGIISRRNIVFYQWSFSFIQKIPEANLEPANQRLADFLLRRHESSRTIFS